MLPISRAYLFAFRPLPRSIDPRQRHSSTSSCPAILSAQLTLTLQKSPQCLFSPLEGTLFVIPDVVLHQILLHAPSKRDHIHYHVSPERLVFEDLCQLSSCNCLPTLLGRKNLRIIKTDSEERTVDINQIPVFDAKKSNRIELRNISSSFSNLSICNPNWGRAMLPPNAALNPQTIYILMGDMFWRSQLLG